MNTRYQGTQSQGALRVAEVILRHASAEGGDGTQQSASFVVDMSVVFEDFVGTALREAMAAYPEAMRLRHNALLNEAVRDSDRIVVEFPLDLSKPPSEILASVADLAQQWWGEGVRQATISR